MGASQSLGDETYESTLMDRLEDALFDDALLDAIGPPSMFLEKEEFREVDGDSIEDDTRGNKEGG